MDKLQPARLEFTPDGIPFSATDCDSGHRRAHAHHALLSGNDLPQRWQNRERFVVLATAFGLGCDFLSTWQAWRNDPLRCQRLHFVAIEKHPFSAADLTAAHAAWPEFALLSGELQAHWPPLTPGVHRLHLDAGQVTLTLVFGDVATQLRAIDAAVDAFYLDAPEPWAPALCHALARLAAPGATLACGNTDTQLRAALSAAEFDTEAQAGIGDQTPILTGRFRSRRPNRHAPPPPPPALVIGPRIARRTAPPALASARWAVPG
ncbi:MAG: MnmC family methyltransferase, partial [Dechloromonas sp.]|nr:MnmC family methyltransferase [Dechloromonas sp.]